MSNTDLIQSKEEYLKNLRDDHKKIEELLKEHWDIDTVYLETLFWGYSSTTYYIKNGTQDYIVRTARNTAEKQISVNKEIFLSNTLHKDLPTTWYLKTFNNNFTIVLEDRLIRVSHFINGMPPFDMNFDIYKQALDNLKILHNFKLPQNRFLRQENPDEKLLHGDLSPSNMLISYGKLVGLLDFESARYGEAEEDLGRSAVLCWFRMRDTKFNEVLEFIMNNYDSTKPDREKLKQYSKETIDRHLNNINNSKPLYDNQDKWTADYNFAQTAGEEITKALLKF